MDVVFNELAKDYICEREKRGLEFIESIIPESVSKDEAMWAITPCLPLNDEEAHRYKNHKDGMTQSFVSTRDKIMYIYLCRRSIELKDKKPCFSQKDEEFLMYAEEKFRKNMRTSKNGQKKYDYVTIEKERGELRIISEKFCSNARLLLELKKIGLNSNATVKQHALYWLGVRTNPPHAFLPEDYWYYEQETGVNLSLALAAYLLSFFTHNEDDPVIGKGQTQNRKIIVDALCDCIRENYCYIAQVPAIDWKMSAMKVACAELVQAMADAFHGKTQSIIQRMAQGIIQLKERKPQKGKQTLTDQEAEFIEFEDKLLQYKMSITFNQLLCLFVIDDFRGAHIFNINDCFKQWPKSMDAKAGLNDPEWYSAVLRDDKYEEKVDDAVSLLRQIKRQNPDKSDTMKPALWTDSGIYDLSGRASEKKQGEKGSQWRQDRQDVLTFCNAEDPFVKLYIEQLRGFIEQHKIFSEDKALIDVPQIERLKQKDYPRRESDLIFLKIQQAVRQAIEKSKKM